MKTPLFVFAALLGASASAFGWGGKLDRPLFGYPSGAQEQRKAQAALKFMHEELKFLDGQFVNQFIHNRFAGTAQQTARFIELLNEAAGWKVRVQFRDFGEQQSAFALDVVMGAEDVVVTVNSGRNDFLLRDFQAFLPKAPLPAQGPVEK